MSNDRDFCVILLCAIFFSGLTGFCLGGCTAQQSMQKAAIQHGYAEYDKVTGKWGWIDEKVDR